MLHDIVRTYVRRVERTMLPATMTTELLGSAVSKPGPLICMIMKFRCLGPSRSQISANTFIFRLTHNPHPPFRSFIGWSTAFQANTHFFILSVCLLFH